MVRAENFEISTCWLKASYSASELHPHFHFALTTFIRFISFHNRHSFIKLYSSLLLVRAVRLELTTYGLIYEVFTSTNRAYLYFLFIEELIYSTLRISPVL